MITKQINCPSCGKQLDYWTKGTKIECTGCKGAIQVEPCEEVKEEVEEEIEVVEVHV